MKRTIKAKLHSRAGESISETLVALLISAVALVMLAGMITAATNAVTTSRTKLTNYYDEINALNEPMDEGADTMVVVITDEAAATDPPYTVNYTENDVFDQTHVIAYEYAP